MKELLYSIRHTESWTSEPEDLGENMDRIDSMSQAELRAAFGDLLNKVENESKFIPVPKRLEIAEKLINHVVTMAGKLELTLDIERYDDRVDFCFYDSVGLFQGELKDFFGDLFTICDSVSMYMPKEGSVPLPGVHWIVDFSYYTHRHLVAGREIPQFAP